MMAFLPQGWILKASAAAFLLVVLAGAYFYEANRIKTAAVQEFVSTQLEQILSDRDSQITQLQQQIRTLAEVQRDLNARQTRNRDSTRAASSRVQQNTSVNGIASERIQIALDSIRAARTPPP